MMSPEGFALLAELLANNELNVDAILAHIDRDRHRLTFQPELGPHELPRCFWCEYPIPTPQDAFLDELLTGVFGYWYCSEACRDAHVLST